MHTRFVLLLLIAVSFPVYAQQFGEVVRISRPYNDDLYAAGRVVDVRAKVEGDAVVAGQTIGINAPVAQDVMAAGELVNIDAPVGDDVRAVGRSVRVNATVGGHALAAGESVEIARGAQIGSFAWLAGRNVAVDGIVRGELKAAAETIRIAGHVAGNAEITAEHLELLPGARIDGNLLWRGRQPPRIDNDAQIGGRLIHLPMPARERHATRIAAWMRIMLVLAFLVTGVVLYLLFPRAAHAGAQAIRRMPLLDALFGFVVLIVTPFLVLLLFITGVGAFLGLFLLLIYIAAILVSALLGTYIATDLVLGRRKKPADRALRTGALAIAILIVGVLQLVPVFGFLLCLWLVFWGMGAIASLLFSSMGDREGASKAQ